MTLLVYCASIYLAAERNGEKEKKMKEHPIFSGDYSKDMWKAINSAKTKTDLRWALYLVCCRLQELETLIEANTKFRKSYRDPHRIIGR